MEDYKAIIAKNISELRKEMKWTQAELAEKLHYSDKAISRWERGDTMPSIEILCELCDLFSVDLSYIVNKDISREPKYSRKKNSVGNKLTITLLGLSVIWLLATCIYVYAGIVLSSRPWLVFMWAVPATALVGQVFNHFWGSKKHSIWILSILTWSLLVCFYLQFLSLNTWLIFLIGIPIEVCIILWCRLK